MPESADWDAATFDGLRRRQHREFAALPLREKLACLDEMNELVEFFAKRRAAREQATPSRPSGAGNGAGAQVEGGSPLAG